MAEVKVIKEPENKKLVIEYVASGPLEKVWRAYTDKTWFEQWWGPEGWETTVTEFNFAPGGRVHYGMKCTDERQTEWYGKTSWGLMEIHSIDDKKSFTYTDYFSDESGTVNNEMPVLKITNAFISEDDKTRITTTAIADSAEQIEELIKMGMIEGFSSQLNKLDRLVV